MTEFSLENLAGLIQSLGAARAQPPTPEDEKANVAFQRVMALVEEKPGEQSDADEKFAFTPPALAPASVSLGASFFVVSMDDLHAAPSETEEDASEAVLSAQAQVEAALTLPQPPSSSPLAQAPTSPSPPVLLQSFAATPSPADRTLAAPAAAPVTNDAAATAPTPSQSSSPSSSSFAPTTPSWTPPTSRPPSLPPSEASPLSSPSQTSPPSSPLLSSPAPSLSPLLPTPTPLTETGIAASTARRVEPPPSSVLAASAIPASIAASSDAMTKPLALPQKAEAKTAPEKRPQPLRMPEWISSDNSSVIPENAPRGDDRRIEPTQMRAREVNLPVERLEKTALEASAAPIRIHVSEFQTHLPLTIVNTLITPSPEANTTAGPILPQKSVDQGEQLRSPLKILKFAVEPAALGSIEVTMRVTHTRVDIQIAADNPSTSALLVDTREALGQAVADAGMSLQSYEVALNVVSPSSGAAGAQGGAHSHEQQQTFSSERGFTNDDGAGQRQRPGAPQRDSRRRERASHDSLPVGLVL